MEGISVIGPFSTWLTPPQPEGGGPDRGPFEVAESSVFWCCRFSFSVHIHSFCAPVSAYGSGKPQALLVAQEVAPLSHVTKEAQNQWGTLWLLLEHVHREVRTQRSNPGNKPRISRLRCSTRQSWWHLSSSPYGKDDLKSVLVSLIIWHPLIASYPWPRSVVLKL